MKKTVFLIMTAIFACLNMVMADTVCSIQGDVIVSSSKYIDPFWSDSIPHSSINYVKKSKITLDATDGYYDINFYRPANGEEIEEDLATFGDVFFSKMVIDYHAHNLTKTTKTTTLYNENCWFPFSFYTFASELYLQYAYEKPSTLSACHADVDGKRHKCNGRHHR